MQVPFLDPFKSVQPSVPMAPGMALEKSPLNRG
jgi:hypothetical protein